MYYLIKFDKDWADEFNVYGFQIFEQVEWDKLYKKLKKNKNKEVSFNFGTNEGWDEEPIQSFLDDIEIIEITEDEKNIIEKLMGDEFGVFPDFEEMLNDED